MKIAMLFVSLVLVAGGATACGGGDKPGDNTASKGDFCGAYTSLQKDLGDIDPTSTSDLSGYIKKLKTAVKELVKIGLPKDVPANAKEGFQLSIKMIEAIPDDATLEDLGKLGEGISEADQAKETAFDDYLAKECPGVE